MTLMLRCSVDDAEEISQVRATVSKCISQTRIDMKAVLDSDQRITSRLPDGRPCPQLKAWCVCRLHVEVGRLHKQGLTWPD